MLSKFLATTALGAALIAAPALAQEASPWDLRDRNAYVLDMQGKMWSKPMTTAQWTMAVRSARAVPRGTVFFMNNGQLYMASAASMFDRASGGALFSR